MSVVGEFYILRTLRKFKAQPFVLRVIISPAKVFTCYPMASETDEYSILGPGSGLPEMLASFPTSSRLEVGREKLNVGACTLSKSTSGFLFRSAGSRSTSDQLRRGHYYPSEHYQVEQAHRESASANDA
jgi:hypothetical protein